MPLKAIINNKEIISSLLNSEDWNNLKQEIKKYNYDVIISQTGKKGYLRKSSLGLQHFAHKQGEKPLDWKPESVQHLLAKDQIVKGCQDAGWQAIPEFKENDWEADILTFYNNIRVAFEVQWSYQTYEKTFERHKKYVRDGIRCCWFFKKLPKELLDEKNNPKANKNLPIFKIFEDKNKNIFVSFYEQNIPIKKFVYLLLTKSIKFSEKLIS